MSKKVDTVRALRDKDYYNSLTQEEQALVPTNPAGDVALNDEALDAVSGGAVADQTGTGSENCFCVLTKTADSAGGHCDCHCDAT